MRETHKFRLDNGNEVTISEMDSALDGIMILLLEEAERDSMSLVINRAEARAIGRALVNMSYLGGYSEEEG